MLKSLFSGVTGMKNLQTKMDVISNNIANVNTTGFKSGRVRFEDMISQSIASAEEGTTVNRLDSASRLVPSIPS
jgi:flagellar hook protein FlgE